MSLKLKSVVLFFKILTCFLLPRPFGISKSTEKFLFDFLKFIRCPFVLRQQLKTLSTNKQFAVLRVIYLRRFSATIE